MTFERPDLLWVVPVAAALVSIAVLAQWRRGVRLVRAYGGPAPAFRLTGRRLERPPLGRLAVLLPAIALLGVAIAGPVAEPDEEIIVTPVDIVIAVDVSHSMTGTDVSPSRIGRARTLIDQLVEAGIADRVSLSIFADWAYRLVPLTDDGDVVSFFAPWVEPTLLNSRDQGTALAGLLEHAAETWQNRAREGVVPVVLLVSDGEDHGDPAGVVAAARALVDAGATVWTAGVGTAAGAPLTLAESSAPLLDGSGRPVVAGFDPALLAEIAEVGRGLYHDVSDESGARALISDLRALSGRTDTAADVEEDRTTWLIALGLALLLIDLLLDSGALARMTATRRPMEAA